ncbi:MAG: SGNH/GDSL hydrolase family protein [Oscillospiraceae bacterium]|nr:SGNH/GDSL hydrolase family protein [Oscillospiraceae bacterium]
MKRVFALLLAVALLLAGCAGTQSAEETTTAGGETMLPKDKEYSILFIGNSYTFYNDMPTVYFQAMAKACGYSLTVATITKGAYTLEKFADPSDPYGTLVKNALSGATKYDFVILQEQSVRPAINAPAFYDGVRALVEKIRGIGAQPILYATWGRETGSDTLEKYNFTNEEMTWQLAASYDAIAKELDIPVAHAGIAFFDLYTGSTLNLYNADKSHPSVTGSYVAAMSLFCKIFEYDPEDITSAGPGTEEENALIRQAVKKIIAEDPVIPEDYKTDSIGITAATEPA